MTQRSNLNALLHKISWISIGLILLCQCSCSLSPKPFTVKEQRFAAQNNIKAITFRQEKVGKKIDFYTALAYGLKYNLDARIRFVNSALQADQLILAEVAMFPALNTSASIYTRNNNLETFATTTTGGSTDTVNATPRTLRSQRVALSWNVLDFGLSYLRAKQQADRYLIAQEEERKEYQTLVQDMTRAYWEAYSAQDMMAKTKAFRALLLESKQKLETALRDRMVPKENILVYQQALFESDRQILQIKNKYTKAMYNLKQLMNLPTDAQVTLAQPPHFLRHVVNLKDLDFKKLDAIALVQRPELRGQNYLERIAKVGVKVAVVQALPGISLSPAYNYNSNKFLLNKRWIDSSADAAWNLLNLLSLPQAIKYSQGQVNYEKMKAMAITLTVLTETRYSFYRYQNTLEEYMVSRSQTQNAEAMYQLVKNRNKAALASTQQIISAKIKAITAKMNEDIALSELTTVLGELYLSAGFDILPYHLSNAPVRLIRKHIKDKFALNKNKDFSRYVEETYKRIFSKMCCEKA